MWNQLIQFHRFLVNQFFYPLVLSTLLSLVIYAGRVVQSHSIYTYGNLLWNLYLAWLPYIFSFFAAILNRLFPRAWWLLIVPGVLWLIFFPNAPYIVTDFLHLESRPYVPLWYDTLLLASFSLTGLFLTIASLRTMQLLVQSYLGKIMSWIFVGVALGLSGLGMYLGRFDRWNSWDVFIHPRTIVNDLIDRLANPFDNLRFFVFTILFTALLFVLYLMFISIRNTDEPKS